MEESWGGDGGGVFGIAKTRDPTYREHNEEQAGGNITRTVRRTDGRTDGRTDRRMDDDDDDGRERTTKDDD